ncbi:metalloprotease ATP23 [Phyllosticta citribraziliensis]|uniref:Mitochondrial inner membrane protease ATP23 n=1 Tax=Phyllosticta citribraziliensis TaxID=989973 RepID=A0ABR1LWY1_9PEZI
MAESVNSESKPAQPTPSADQVQPDENFYNWSTFFTILSGQASKEDQQKYFRARDLVNEESDIKRVEKQRDWLFQNSPVIRFLRDEINKLGGDINPMNVRIRRCTTSQGGGIDQDYGILICANYMRNQGHVEDTIAHEMVHAYDYMRFKVDRWNLRHQACTEIRASTLSGECRFTREFFTRGQWRFTQQMQECVRRRATLSLMARPSVKDDVHAARIVNEVWDSCFNDTRPFDEIYR